MYLEISYEWGSLIKFWFNIGSKKYYTYCMWSYDIICISHNRFTKSKANYQFYYELGTGDGSTNWTHRTIQSVTRIWVGCSLWMGVVGLYNGKSDSLPYRVKCLAEFEDTKGAIIIRISKNNGQKKKYKRTNNDLQNIHIKLKIE